MATENLYTLLGVKSDATTRQIRDAYRALARTLHPDTRSESIGHGDLNKMARVNDAWHVLSDSRRRKEYDQSSVSLNLAVSLRPLSMLRQSFILRHHFRGADF